MENREIIITLQNIKDLATGIYDEMRFNNSKISYKSFDNLRKINKGIEKIYDELEKAGVDCYKIIATEDTIIENEQKVEIKTNLTGFNDNIMEDVIFNGYIPSDGYLIPRCNYSIYKGMIFSIRNIVPREVYEAHDVCGYHYCDPTSTRYFSPGIYKIEKGTPIGIAFIKNLDDETKRMISVNIESHDKGKVPFTKKRD